MILKHFLEVSLNKDVIIFYNEQLKNKNIGLPVDVFRIIMSDVMNSHLIK